MRLLIVASMLSAVLLNSQVSAQIVLDGSFPADAGVSIGQLHQAVSADFLDPSSAQYKKLVYRNKAFKPVICGLVNAHNTMGGYTPFYPFSYSVDDDKANVAEDYNDEILGKLVTMGLEGAGCPLSAVGLD